MLNKKIIIYPYLFAAYPVFYLYHINIEQTGLHVILLPVIILVAITFLLMKITNSLWNDNHKSAIAISIFFVWFFSYSAVRSLITFTIYEVQIYRHRYFIIIWILLFMILSILYIRVKINYNSVGKYMSFLSIATYIVLGFSVLTETNKKAIQSFTKQQSIEVPNRKESNNNGAAKPDIYYIILDAYSGNQSLSEILEFDNSDFLNYLKKKGFFIAEKSHSNYAWTIQAMTSTFNMEYLPTVSINENSTIRTISPKFSLYNNLINNKVINYLKNYGYKYIDLSIWSNSSLFYTNPKYYREHYFTNAFNLALLKMTILDRPLVENWLLGKVKRNTILKKFNSLQEPLFGDRPHFIYAHILIPHHPYVFLKDGSAPRFLNTFFEIGVENELYLEQLQYANRKMMETIDKILSKKRNSLDPIIIIQGDHGAYNLSSKKEENIKLRMNILNAYYLPDSSQKYLYDSITPVNTFRLLLGRFFGYDINLIKDSSYYSTMESFNELVDVTSIVKE